MKIASIFPALIVPTALLALVVGPGYVSSDQLVLEEVVVTAQKRVQSLQDVPISIVAFGRDKLAAKGIDELTDISASVPNLVVNPFNNDPGAVRLFLRGIGQNDVQLTQDPSVALYLDGVYIGSSFGSGFEGVDIERIEVLRGPQGTLYGRNATGGAVNIITQRARVEALEFQQSFTVGNLGAFKSRTMINLPLSASFAAKLNYLISERDGNVDNQGPGADFGEEDRRSAVVDLRWLAAQDVTLDYRYEQADMADTQRFEQVTELNPAGQLAPFISVSEWSPGRLDSVTSLREIKRNSLEISAHTLQLDWLASETHRLKSITAFREFDNEIDSDPLSTLEGNGLFFSGASSTAHSHTTFKQFSQEFQWLGESDRFHYVTGLYFYRDEGDVTGAGSTTFGALRATNTTATQNTSMAIFGEATYTPTIMAQRWHITLGGRGSMDNRQALRTNLNIAVPIVEGKYDKDFTNFNPALTVSFDLEESVNVYAKLVSGFKSGGTSQRSANAELFAEGFGEEEILSFELGFKGDFWGGRARLNAALFSMSIDGRQSSVQTGATPGERDFLPVDDNSVDGLEMDLSLLLAAGLSLDLGFGYLDTQLGAEQIDSPAGSFLLVDSFAYAPKTSYSAGLDYRRELNNAEFSSSLSYSYQDDFNGSINQLSNRVHDGYGLWGASASWANIRLGKRAGSLKLLLWGKNLADKQYTTSGGGSWRVFGVGKLVTFGDRRTFGATLSYRYQ